MVVPLHVQDCARDVIILVQAVAQVIAQVIAQVVVRVVVLTVMDVLAVMDVRAVAQAVQEDVGVAVGSVAVLVVDGKDCNL